MPHKTRVLCCRQRRQPQRRDYALLHFLLHLNWLPGTTSVLQQYSIIATTTWTAKTSRGRERTGKWRHHHWLKTKKKYKAHEQRAPNEAQRIPKRKDKTKQNNTKITLYTIHIFVSIIREVKTGFWRCILMNRSLLVVFCFILLLLFVGVLWH